MFKTNAKLVQEGHMDDKDSRDRILKAAEEILAEVSEVEKITVRQIAERANVGIGLINYHFKSKDNLLSIAVGDAMAKMAVNFTKPNSSLKPARRLKVMLKELFSYAENYEKLMQFSLTHSILNGEMEAELFLIPILKEIFGDKKDEMQLRIIAMQILLPLQAAGVDPSSFRVYSGIDLKSDEQRNDLIDTLVDNLVK